MKRVWLVLVSVLLASGANADPTDLEGGVLIAHHPPGLQYSAGEDYCAKYFTDFALDSCADQNNRIDLDGNNGETSVWYVLACWSESKEWCGVEFGFGAYDPDIYAFAHWGPCGRDEVLEIGSDNWPGPGEGTALAATDSSWTGDLTPVYYFSGYAYEQGTISLGENPSTGFLGTTNCETPPQQWEAADFGAMGIFEDGIDACPEIVIDGGEGPGGDDQAEDEGGGGGEGSQDDNSQVWTVCAEQATFTTIKQAIEDYRVQDGDTLELCCDNTFAGSENRNIEFGGKRLVVRSECRDAARCIIDCQGRYVMPSLPQARRAFVFLQNDTVTVENVTIYDGRAYDPGG